MLLDITREEVDTRIRGII
jgi:hypothetical protein